MHGFLHTFIGGSLIAALLSLIMIRFDDRIQKIMTPLRLKQNHSRKKIWLTSYVGVYMHIIMDSFLYLDIKPFYPLKYNPIYSLLGSFEVYFLLSKNAIPFRG